MKTDQHIPDGLALDFAQDMYVSHREGVPYCRGKLHNCVDLQVLSKEPQGMVSFGANINDMSVHS